MRQKIDYGINLGTTNSAIAQMEGGGAVILKSDLGFGGDGRQWSANRLMRSQENESF